METTAPDITVDGQRSTRWEPAPEGRHYSVRASDDYARPGIDEMKPDRRTGGVSTAVDQIQEQLSRLGEQISLLHDELGSVLRGAVITTELKIDGRSEPGDGALSGHAELLRQIADRAEGLMGRVAHIRGHLDL